ncbi:amidase family protein [Enterococcus larvae]|uniref:amidase family protein n=1 Tax=Enterococcus larvae TaxID=2794352 RepID=UPI003F3A4406
MNNPTAIEGAKKSFIALKNPYASVEKVYPMIIEQFQKENPVYYVGVKNRSQISQSFIKSLEAVGIYLHTLDKASIAGRAVDMQLKNPYTGRPMTGSSSGTAINVLLGINDIGIGTDGGGSVLAPAMAVNLIGFISPLLDQEHMKNTASKISTDGISFHPSLGFITGNFQLLWQVLHTTLPIAGDETTLEIIYDPNDFSKVEAAQWRGHIHEKVLSFKFDTRDCVMPRLKELLKSCDVLVSKEGPVDTEGLGDTVLGHFDERTQKMQRQGNKGFLRVVNMLGATAITLPTEEFAVGVLLICESTPQKISRMLRLAEKWQKHSNPYARYFSDCGEYYPQEFGE